MINRNKLGLTYSCPISYESNPICNWVSSIGEILKEIMPMIEPAQKPDPLVAIREKELENDTADLQRRSINDMMNFQIDSAKLAQAYELAQQRTKTQEQIAEDRNDVNIYRINTQASLKGR